MPAMKSFHRHLLLLLVLCAAFTRVSSAADYSSDVKVTPLLRTSNTVTGQPIQYPRTGRPQITMLMVEIPPGKQTGWHIHRMPMSAYILSGTLKVEFRGGKSATYKSGQAIAEALNTPHNGVNIGRDTVRILVTVFGEKGIPVADKLNK